MTDTDPATPGTPAPTRPVVVPAADPATGTTTGLVGAVIVDTPLEDLLPAARRDTATDATGAVVTFEGVVRDHDGGRAVTALTYTAHPDAERVMAEVVAACVRDHPGVRVWAAHRVGPLGIGDLAFAVVCASAHRGPAFAAVADVADRVKSGVPVWKEQRLADGSTDWVGLS
ncbi:molybdenum cofactor biosynthesis protein MoaE [Corynebacterium bovis]